MDYLNLALKNLSSKEIYLLKNRIRNQAKKIRLFEIIQKEGDLSNKELSQAISYGPKLTNLYALKNRLLNDLIHVKLDLNRTEVIETREMVQSIRSLVYSRDKNILIRQLKMLRKKCEILELYAELREVYFCFQLLNRHDVKKSEKYRRLMREADHRQQLQNRLEEVFYFKVLVTQDLFFYPHQDAYQQGIRALDELHAIHRSLQSESSLFLYLSGELTLNLNLFFKEDKKEEYHEKLNLLLKTYQNPVVADKYPNCTVAIECLFSRFYLLTSQGEEFERVQETISRQVKNVRGYQMFDASFLYFVYAECCRFMDKGKKNELIRFIGANLSEDMEPSDMTTQVSFEFLRAVREFYKENYYKASSILLKSRICFSFLDQLSSWSAVENVLLNILCCVLSGDRSTLRSEAGLLKRILKKFKYNRTTSKLLDAYVKDLIRVDRNDELAYSKVLNILRNIRSDTSFMRIVEL